MFTGIIEQVGRVERVEPREGALRIAVHLGELAEGLKIGDSVAVSGCCLTVVRIERERAEFDVVPETLERTWFRSLEAGTRVNLERPLRASDRLDGHIVQGHVDGVARVAARVDNSASGTRLDFECDPRLADDMVEKGSIALDGVSLTLTHVAPGRFGVALIPHTLAVTTFYARARGDLVNVETDMVGKWVRRLVAPYLPKRE